VTLLVLASNERARGFYERRGWVRDGTEHAHEEVLFRPQVRYVLG
jgi:hypothetical protein